VLVHPMFRLNHLGLVVTGIHSPITFPYHRSVRVPHVRTSVRGPNKMGEAPQLLCYPRLKAIEKSRLRPTYAGANMGHPDRAVLRGT
jgi:hypothetical protein